MLSLDDTRWGELQHAYGSANDIPALLIQLAASTTPKSNSGDEPWFSLWSSLCHQGDVYTASYAAVPHIVEMAANADGSIDFSFFYLPAMIEIARATGRGPDIPTDLSDEYRRAIERLGDIVCANWNQPWDRPMLLSAVTAQAVAKGDFELAEALGNLDDDWITQDQRIRVRLNRSLLLARVCLGLNFHQRATERRDVTSRPPRWG